MGSYTIFLDVENPRRGRQARNVTTKFPTILEAQIVFRSDIFQNVVTLGAPEFLSGKKAQEMTSKCQTNGNDKICSV